jgi:hypothetical protein
MRRLEDWVRNIEVVAVAVGVLILVILYIVSRVRG